MKQLKKVCVFVRATYFLLSISCVGTVALLARVVVHSDVSLCSSSLLVLLCVDVFVCCVVLWPGIMISNTCACIAERCNPRPSWPRPSFEPKNPNMSKRPRPTVMAVSAHRRSRERYAVAGASRNSSAAWYCVGWCRIVAGLSFSQVKRLCLGVDACVPAGRLDSCNGNWPWFVGVDDVCRAMKRMRVDAPKMKCYPFESHLTSPHCTEPVYNCVSMSAQFLGHDLKKKKKKEERPSAPYTNSLLTTELIAGDTRAETPPDHTRDSQSKQEHKNHEDRVCDCKIEMM